MNATDAQPKRMSLGKKLLVGLLLWMAASVVIITAFVASFFFLDSNASLLRRQVMAASGRDWDTKVQVSVRPVAVSMARLALRFIPDVPDEARLAMKAVRAASVGVYELPHGEQAEFMGEWLHEADRRMANRGFTRLVRVNDRQESARFTFPGTTTTATS